MIMVRLNILVILIMFLFGCNKLDNNITSIYITAEKDTLLANNTDFTALNISLEKEPHKDQTVLVSTSVGKLYKSPMFSVETEGQSSFTYTPNSENSTIYLKSGRSFKFDPVIVTAVVNGNVVDTCQFTFLPSCPEEIVVTLDKNSIGLNINQDLITAEITTYCENGAVSDDIRIDYTISDSTIIEVFPKILKTSNETISFEIKPKKVGTAEITFLSNQNGCDEIKSSTVQIEVFKEEEIVSADTSLSKL